MAAQGEVDPKNSQSTRYRLSGKAQNWIYDSSQTPRQNLENRLLSRPELTKPPKYLHLIPEIANMVTDLLSIQDIKQLRLTCRLMRDIGDTCLFREGIVVPMMLDSILRLEDLTRNRRLTATITKAFIYPLRWIQPSSRERWEKKVVEAEFIRDEELALSDDLTGPEEKRAIKIMKFYSARLGGLTSLEKLVLFQRSEDWIKMHKSYLNVDPCYLVRTAQLLENLQTIRIGQSPPWKIISRLTGGFSETLIRPCLGEFWSVCATLTTTFRCGVGRKIRNLEYLVSVPMTEEVDMVPFAPFLEKAVFGFQHAEVTSDCHQILGWFCGHLRDMDFGRLRHLTITNAWIHGDDLEEFLCNYTPSLREVKLGGVELGTTSKGWRELFDRLRRRSCPAKLQNLLISGDLRSSGGRGVEISCCKSEGTMLARFLTDIHKNWPLDEEERRCLASPEAYQRDYVVIWDIGKSEFKIHLSRPL